MKVHLPPDATDNEQGIAGALAAAVMGRAAKDFVNSFLRAMAWRRHERLRRPHSWHAGVLARTSDHRNAAISNVASQELVARLICGLCRMLTLLERRGGCAGPGNRFFSILIAKIEAQD